MSLADQIADMEDELSSAMHEVERLSAEVRTLESDLDDLTFERDELEEFVNYIDKTHPELRTAFDAARVLEGVKV